MNKQAIEATQRMIDRDRMFESLLRELITCRCSSCDLYYDVEPCNAAPHARKYNLIQKAMKLL